MEIDYHTVNHDLRPEHRELVEEELDRLAEVLQNFPRPVFHVEIERSARKGGFGVGIHAKLSTRPLFASAWGGDLRSAVELATDRVVRQAKKHLSRLRQDERAGAETPRQAVWDRGPSATELEAMRDIEEFREEVGHLAARLNQVLRRERRLDPRAETAGGRVSIPDIVEDALTFVFEHWREKPPHLTADRWLVRRGLILLDEELERAMNVQPGSETATPAHVVPEEWEDLMDLPILNPTHMDRRPADAWQASPEVIVDRRRAQRETAEALKGLSDRQRKTVVLHHLEGYDLAEIAFVLNASEDQVEMWLGEGETELRDRLSDRRD